MIELQNYFTFLTFIQEKLDKFFEKQKPYIFCKRGCGMCCKDAQFPYSRIEMRNLLIGYSQLPPEKLQIVDDNITKVLERRKKYRGKKFLYDCPFLIDNECSIYNHRGLICRVFGLMSNGKNDKVQVPFCCFKGYNYSNVLNLRTKKVSIRKFKKLGIEQEPASYNMDYFSLIDPDFERGFNFKFGEVKSLIDWFVDEKEEKKNKKTKKSKKSKDQTS